MMDVRSRQNSERSLDRLAAQRFLYRQVKTVENWRLVLVLVVAGLLLTGLTVKPAPFSQGATMAVVLLWFVDQVVLVRSAGRKKEEAAAIQEDFDCIVLDMPWPKHLGVARPTNDRVAELKKKASGAGVTRNELADWYCADDIPVEAVAARLHCQRINCHWDERLRREWICLVKFVVGAFAVVGVVLGVVVGVTLLTVVLGVAAGIRLLAWLLLEQRAQSLAKERVKNLHEYLSRAEVDMGQITLCDVRLTQAAIFEHRRVCPTVPEWFYNNRSKAYEGKEQG